MERLKAMVAPREFTTIKVTKSTLDFIRFEGEVANKPVMEDIISRIDAKHMKLSGFSEPFKIKCGPAKSNYPTKVKFKLLVRIFINIMAFSLTGTISFVMQLIWTKPSLENVLIRCIFKICHANFSISGIIFVHQKVNLSSLKSQFEPQ